MIRKYIAGHLINPRLKLQSVFVAAAVLDHPQKYILGKVFSQFPVRSQTRQKIENALMVPFKKQGRQLEVTAFYGFHDHLVCHQALGLSQFSCWLPGGGGKVTKEISKKGGGGQWAVGSGQ